MHAFFLGNFKRHCRNIWGFDISFTDDDGSTRLPDQCDEPDKEAMDSGELILRLSNPKKLFTLTVPVLFHLCSRYDCVPAERFWKRKKRLVGELLSMVSTCHLRALTDFLTFSLEEGK